MKIEEVHQKWIADCRCPLKKTATQPVPGEGNEAAQIVFIGEAPGKQEDEAGRPFVGAAGQFLNEMLKEIKMKREDVYITNIVKYRPPNNRDPEPSEKEDCIGWLYDELNFIKPKLIVFLGRHSLLYFFPTEQISKIHGKLLIKEIPNLPTKYFFPLYHPAAALYNSSLKETLISDFKKIPKILEKINQPNQNRLFS